MLIEVACPTCGAKFQLQYEVAGPVWTCGNCRTKIGVPQNSAAAQTQSPSEPAPSNAFEMIPWENFRVASQIAAWGTALGVAGTLSYGLLMFGFQTNLRGGGDVLRSFQMYFVLMMLSVIALGLELAFAIASAAVCRSSRVTSAALDWGNRSLLSFIASIAVVVFAFPFLPNLLQGPEQTSLLIMNGVVLLTQLGYLAGHACLAIAFTKVTDGLGQGSLRPSLVQYLMLLVGLAIWSIFNLFVWDNSGVMGRDPFLVAGPIDQVDYRWAVLLTTVTGMVMQFHWLRFISRRAELMVRRHQITFA